MQCIYKYIYMSDINNPCHVLSTTCLIKATGVCTIRPKKGSKLRSNFYDIEEPYWDSKESSNFHLDEQAVDSFPSHLLCAESTTGWNNEKAEGLRAVISLK